MAKTFIFRFFTDQTNPQILQLTKVGSRSVAPTPNLIYFFVLLLDELHKRVTLCAQWICDEGVTLSGRDRWTTGVKHVLKELL